MLWMSESAGTTKMSCSPTSRATGVVCSSDTGEPVVRMPPTRAKPTTSPAWPRCRPVMNCARPTVPPPPATFATCTFETRSLSCSTLCIARAS